MGDEPPNKLPVHGFVLAGGKSSRMGVDKALLRFCGRPMVEIALEKLRGFCAEVGIAGNRADLGEFAPVVREERVDVGPAAGIEAGLKAAREEWVMFVPVDVPLVPEELLRRWVEMTLGMNGLSASNLYFDRDQPAFCMLQRGCVERFSEALNGGERRLGMLLERASEGFRWVFDMDELYGDSVPGSERWFANVNTPEELAAAERWALGEGGNAG
ncbi:MAG: molybdenum cofactor guanylyltransferase [Acidobacteriaceae bacterium]